LDPDVALEEFPDTEYLLKHNLLLPLHQDIDQRACERVVGALRQWFASLGEQ
jgi:dTDP-4-amino-4,6-dideoxygalactose transaminase